MFRKGSTTMTVLTTIVGLGALGVAGYATVTGKSLCSMFGSCDSGVKATSAVLAANHSGDGCCPLGDLAQCNAPKVRMVVSADLAKANSCEAKSTCADKSSCSDKSGVQTIAASTTSAKSGCCSGKASCSGAKTVAASNTSAKSGCCGDKASCSGAKTIAASNTSAKSGCCGDKASCSGAKTVAASATSAKSGCCAAKSCCASKILAGRSATINASMPLMIPAAFVQPASNITMQSKATCAEPKVLAVVDHISDSCTPIMASSAGLLVQTASTTTKSVCSQTAKAGCCSGKASCSGAQTIAASNTEKADSGCCKGSGQRADGKACCGGCTGDAKKEAEKSKDTPVAASGK